MSAQDFQARMEQWSAEARAAGLHAGTPRAMRKQRSGPWLRLLIALALPVAALLAYLAYTAAPGSRAHTALADPAAMAAFEDTALIQHAPGGYALQVPASWRALTEAELPALDQVYRDPAMIAARRPLAFSDSPAGAQSQVNLLVWTDPAPNASSAETAQSVVDVMRGASRFSWLFGNGISILEPVSELTVAGRPAAQYVASMEVGGARWINRSVTLEAGGAHIVLMIVWREGAASMGATDKIVHSLQLLPQ